MSKFSRDLKMSLGQAIDFANSKKVPGMRVTVVEVSDVKAIRKKPKEAMKAVKGKTA